MCRTVARFALGIAILGLVGTTVSAQEPGRGRGGRGMMGGPGGGGAQGLVTLASNEQVAKHLSLTDDQKAFLKMLGEELREESTKFFESTRDLSREERGEKIREWTAKQTPEIEKKLTEILGDKLKRLKQVRLQVQGAMAFGDVSVQKDLGITEEQKTKMQEIMQGGFAQMREIFQSAGEDPDARRKAMEDFQKEQGEKIMAVLTDAQKSKLKELKGDPIDFKVDMMMMGGRGGRGGPPGGEGKGGGDNKRRGKRAKKGDGDGKPKGDGEF